MGHCSILSNPTKIYLYPSMFSSITILVNFHFCHYVLLLSRPKMLLTIATRLINESCHLYYLIFLL